MFYIGITIFFWASSFVATKVLLAFLSPYAIAFERFFVAYIILLLINHKREKYSLKDRIDLIFSSLTGVTLYFIFENQGLVFTSPTNASLIINAVPVFTTILYDFKARKVPDKIEYFGMFLAFTGTVIVILNGKFILKLNPVGDTLIVFAALSWAFYTLFIENILKKHSYIVVLRDMFLLGSIFLLPFSFYDIIRSGFTWIFDLRALISFLFLSVLASSLGYFFWNRGIKEINSKVVTNSIYFMPLITSVEDIYITKGKVNIFHIIGGITILFGVILINRRLKNEKNLS
jgi:drug/metabolite transporter (DMT)-like permease